MRSPAWSSAFALALLAAAGLGCAQTPPKKMTFEEAGLASASEPEGPVEPPVQRPNPDRQPAEPPSGPSIGTALLRFAAQARRLRRATPAGQGFPTQAVAAWRDLAGQLDGYLARPLPQTPLLEIVQIRVTVEAELEGDRLRYGAPPAEVAELVTLREQRFGVRIAAFHGLSAYSLNAPPPLIWPIERPEISSRFGMRVHPLDGHARMHSGVDLAAELGRPVFAAAPGFVVRAGWTSGYGLMVEVRHSGRVTTRYSHLSRILCTAGDPVEAGHPLGLVGATGKATGPHLHFEVWQGSHAVDPLPLLVN